MESFPGFSEDSENDEKRVRYIVKVVIVGDYAVGKTSLVRRFSENKFDHDYKPSLGVNIVTKSVDVGEEKIQLKIFDTGGQERFRPLRQRYYFGAQAVIYVFDITRADSAFGIQDRWVNEVEHILGSDYERLILANKTDLPGREVSEYAGRQFAERFGGTYHETSAFDGSNVDRAFSDLAVRLMRKHFSEA